MNFQLSGTSLLIFLLIACFPADALAIGNYLYFQVRITTLDIYMFTKSYWLYRKLKKDGFDFPFRYTSIRKRNQ